MSDEPVYRRMQVKVLYLFNDNGTVFLSRSRNPHSIKIAHIPVEYGSTEGEVVTLGAFDLKSCAQQILKNSPENFHLNLEDYAVYYKDVTEQPDEPFVSNGVMLDLLSSTKQHLIPGRVCQNLSASFLFGDKAQASALTLEIRLKLHTITKSASKEDDSSKQQASEPVAKRQRVAKPPPLLSSTLAAAKATRTKSLPIFYQPPNQHVFNIINADRANAPSKYDNKSVQDRFKLAPFLSAKIIDNPKSRPRRRENRTATTPVDMPARAVRTRSMVTTQTMVSSPINEETISDASDDSEYNANAIEEEQDEADGDDSSPYTPLRESFKSTAAPVVSSGNNQFHSLPALEDLDSKKTHTIPDSKLPADHGLVCTNSNCATKSSIMWRYFETQFHPNYLAIHKAEKFDKKNYEGMFGPLCNACYLFLRNKGFMRPEGVVKKYLKQKQYKKELKQKDSARPITSSSPPQGKFLTPSHTPSAINQAIQNNNNKHYSDLADFMNQLNNFGGPLTDIDPLPQQQLGVTPPMMATKSNTRVINLYDDGEDKENWDPEDSADFEQMLAKSFKDDSPDQSQWSTLFGEPTPKDHTTPKDKDIPQMKTFRPSPPKLDKAAAVVNMPSSPLLNVNIQNIEDQVNHMVANEMLNSSSPAAASRLDTVMSHHPHKHSSPHSEYLAEEEKL